MLSRAVGHMGAQREAVPGHSDPPRQVIVGDDGSVAFEVTTRVFRPTGESITSRTRYVVFDALAVRAALDEASTRPALGGQPRDPSQVIFDSGRGRVIPASPTAPDADADDLPEPLRPGRRTFASPRDATPKPTQAEALTQAHLAAVAVPLGDGTTADPRTRPRRVLLRRGLRDHRDPAGAVAAGVLIVPAAIADVITFPVQFPLFLQLYGSDQPAPDWSKPFMTPAPGGPR